MVTPSRIAPITRWVTYDLTANTFSHVQISAFSDSDNLTFLINNAVTADVQSFQAFSLNDKLVTASSTLDLSHTTVSGFTVASSNGLGTTFTVGDLGTAFQIAGGSGHDALIAQDFTLTVDQRTAIFEASSIETITDQSGSYTSGGVVNHAPMAADDCQPWTEDTSAAGNVLADDTDPDGNALIVTQFIVADEPTIYSAGETATINRVGILLINADGSYTLTPEPDYTGAVPAATYTVSDKNGGTDMATLTFGPVTSVNDAPTGAPIAVLANGTEDVTYTVAAAALLSGFSDVDGDTLTVANLLVRSG